MALTLAGDGTVTGLDWGASGGGLTLITTQSFSAASSVSVDDCFTSDYENYRIIFDGRCAASPTTEGIMLRMRVGGVDNSTAGAYGYGSLYVNGGASGRLYGTASDSLGLVWWAGNEDSFSDITVIRPAVVGYTMWSGAGYSRYDSSDVLLTLGGICHTSAAYDGFTLLGDTGSTFTGTLRVYGYTQ
jgi:hypothetical protein